MNLTIFLFVAICVCTSNAFFGKGKKKEEEARKQAKLGADMLIKTMSDPNAMHELQEMMNDPEVMKEVEVLLQDPNFVKEYEELKKNPEFIRSVMNQGIDEEEKPLSDAELGFRELAKASKDPSILKQTLEVKYIYNYS